MKTTEPLASKPLTGNAVYILWMGLFIIFSTYLFYLSLNCTIYIRGEALVIWLPAFMNNVSREAGDVWERRWRQKEERLSANQNLRSRSSSAE